MQRTFFTAITIAALMGLAGPAAATEIVHFTPGTYLLSNHNLDAPVDTLVVTVSGGIANFTLTGADSAMFSVPDASIPTQLTSGRDPLYSIPTSGITASWDTTAFPILTFFSTADEGGLEVTSATMTLIDLFQSTQGTGQVFTLTDAPEPMTLALFGAGLAGAAAFGRRRKMAQAA